MSRSHDVIMASQEVRVLDLAGIMVSSVMMLFVIVRAVQLDRTQPWFQSIARKDRLAGTAPRSWQRRG